ncbi:hypothetical protein HD599_003223 [Conyzicola lurida]|uniref:Uncharacterized protein n=1 Tax=Conyzicola lurida TaxID=1172621 RepID=A0A841ALN5_9MICO|nr:hypothetical protein [Conyzicola lurida]MBB5844900.1 hypothetical protein [Conyzicola lurida]
MDKTNEAPATERTELIGTVARLLFVTRTGELPSVWPNAPESTRARYIGEAEALAAADLLKDVG